MTMAWTIAYNDGNGEKREGRRDIIATAAKRKIMSFRGAVNAQDFKEKLSNVPGEGDAIVCFVHFTPIETLAGGWRDVLAHASGGLTRLYLVFVSGELMTDAGFVRDAIDLARKKGFGGCTYWPWRIDISAKELQATFCHLEELFDKYESPTFEQFHEVIHSPVSVTASIMLRWADVAGEDLAGDDLWVKRLLENVSEKRALSYLSDEKRRQLVQLVEMSRKYEVARSRLRHHDLGNRLLPSITRALRAVRGEIVAPDWVADISTVLGQRARIKEELKRIIELRKEWEGKSALWMRQDSQAAEVENIGDVKVSRQLAAMRSAGDTLNQALDELSDAVSNSRSLSEEDLGNVLEACRLFLDQLDTSS